MIVQATPARIGDDDDEDDDFASLKRDSEDLERILRQLTGGQGPLKGNSEEKLLIKKPPRKKRHDESNRDVIIPPPPSYRAQFNPYRDCSLSRAGTVREDLITRTPQWLKDKVRKDTEVKERLSMQNEPRSRRPLLGQNFDMSIVKLSSLEELRKRGMRRSRSEANAFIGPGESPQGRTNIRVSRTIDNTSTVRTSRYVLYTVQYTHYMPV